MPRRAATQPLGLNALNADQPARDDLSRRVIAAEHKTGGDPAATGISEQQWHDAVFGRQESPLSGALVALTPDNIEDVPGSRPQTRQDAPQRTFGERITGGAEAALSAATGIVAAPIGAAVGLFRGLTGGKYGTQEGAEEAKARAAEIAASLTYQPRSEAGQEALRTLGDVVGASKIEGLGPMAVTGGAGTLARVGQGPLRVPKVAPAATAEFGSVGAQAADVAARARAAVAAASPELQAAVEKTAEKLDARGLATLERHVQADSLPVPIRLTQGQATREGALFSQEQNARALKPEIADRLTKQNEQLGENVQAIRESAAPDVFTADRPQMGEHLIDAYRAKDAAERAKVSAAYQALKEANGGAFPLDAKGFVETANGELHKGLKYEFLPKEIRLQMKNFAANGMTFEQFEGLRTNLANIARSGADGNVKQAAAIVRNALEEMPMPAGAEHLKPLADAARTANKAYRGMIEADPAWKAVTKGKASADRFLEKHVLGADRKNVETMVRNLSGDATARQVMAAGALDALKKGAYPSGGEIFQQAGYNRALGNLRPKLDAIFEAKDRSNLERLGEVARYIKEEPAGGYVNRSNTAVTLMGEAVKKSAEGAANVAAHGVPVGSFLRRAGGYISEQRNLSRSLEPGAGIKLKEVGKRGR